MPLLAINVDGGVGAEPLDLLVDGAEGATPADVRSEAEAVALAETAGLGAEAALAESGAAPEDLLGGGVDDVVAVDSGNGEQPVDPLDVLNRLRQAGMPPARATLVGPALYAARASEMSPSNRSSRARRYRRPPRYSARDRRRLGRRVTAPSAA